MLKKYFMVLLLSNFVFSMDYMRLKFFPVNDQELSEILESAEVVGTETFSKDQLPLVIDALTAINFGMLKPDAFRKLGGGIFSILLQYDEIPISLIENLSHGWENINFSMDFRSLCRMVRRQSVKLLTFYFEHVNTKLDFTNFRGTPFIQQLMKANNVDCLQVCIKNGLPINQPIEQDMSLLDFSVANGATNIMKFLLEQDVPLGKKTFNMALRDRNESALLVFLEHEDASYEKALDLATTYNLTAVFEKYLYDSDRDAATKRSDYNSALVEAAHHAKDFKDHHAYKESFKTLYSRPLFKITDKNYIMSAVIEGGSEELLDLLLAEQDLSVFSRNPLELAIEKKQVSLALKLIDAGFSYDFSIRDMYSNPETHFIHMLLERGFEQVLDVVLKKKPQLIENTVNSENKTPLQVAIRKFFKNKLDDEMAVRNHPVIAVLLSHGANTNLEGIPTFLQK